VTSPVYETMSSDGTQNGTDGAALLTALETVVDRLVLLGQEYQFNSKTFEVAVSRAIKSKYQPARFRVNGMRLPL
jgi:hypothetical protein